MTLLDNWGFEIGYGTAVAANNGADEEGSDGGGGGSGGGGGGPDEDEDKAHGKDDTGITIAGVGISRAADTSAIHRRRNFSTSPKSFLSWRSPMCSVKAHICLTVH